MFPGFAVDNTKGSVVGNPEVPGDCRATLSVSCAPSHVSDDLLCQSSVAYTFTTGGAFGMKDQPAAVAPRLPTSFDTISSIVGRSAGHKMGGVDAGRVVACVADDDPFWDRPIHRFPGDLVRLTTSHVALKLAVPITINTASPRPTSFRPARTIGVGKDVLMSIDSTGVRAKARRVPDVVGTVNAAMSPATLTGVFVDGQGGAPLGRSISEQVGRGSENPLVNRLARPAQALTNYPTKGGYAHGL